MNRLIDKKTIDVLKNNIQHLNIQKFTISENINLKIDKVKILLINNELLLFMDDDVTKEYFKDWSDSEAGIVLADVKNNTLSNYYSVKYNDLFYLLRECSNNEAYDIKTVDKSYIIITMSEYENFNISNYSYNYVVEEDIEIDTSNEPDLTSLSLFNTEDINFNYE